MVTKTQQQQQRLIGAISLGERNEIRVVIVPYRNKEYVHVRHYFEDSEGQWLPTKKGVALDTELVGELKALIDKVAEFD